MTSAPAIAVVIPTLDEESFVAAAIASARDGSASAAAERLASGPRASGAEPDAVEVIVVDGGSRDGTVRLARRAGARVIGSEPGRGRQLDAGWRETSAPVVLFLHADTLLPSGWRDAVAGVLEADDVAGGAFRFAVQERGVLWRAIELGVAVRVSLFGLPYGDQAIFVRRDVLEASGGVPHVAILEDLDLVRAIKRAGRLGVLRARVHTSARRYRGRLIATLAGHALALAGFFLGVDRGWLARRVRG